MKEQITKVTSNPIGAIAGAAAGYFAAKKWGGGNKWVYVGATVVGIFVGATIQAKIKAKAGAPTAATIKK